MNRLKFVVYWIVVLIAFALALRGTPALLPSVDELVRPLVGAAATVSAGWEAENGRLDTAAGQLGQGQALLNAVPRGPDGKPQPMTAERFNQIRGEFVLGIPESARPSALVAVFVGVDGGTIIAKGEAAAGAATEQDTADLAPVVANGATAVMASVAGKPYALRNRPLFGIDKNEVRSVGTVLVGTPAFSTAAAVAPLALKASGATALAIVSAGTPVAIAGDKALIEKALKQVKPTTAGVFTEGKPSAFGPFSLPLWTDLSPLTVALRQEVQGAPYEVLAIRDVTPYAERVADIQRLLLVGLLVTLLGGAVLLWLLNNGPAEAERPNYSIVAPPEYLPPLSTSIQADNAPVPAPVVPNVPMETMTPSIPPPMPHMPAMTLPDDVPGAGAAQPAPSAPQMPLGSPFDSDGDSQPTVAYPAGRAAFADAQASAGDPLNSGLLMVPDPFEPPARHFTGEVEAAPIDHPDTTRVAPVPAELMRAARAASDSMSDFAPPPDLANTLPAGMAAARPSLPPFVSSMSSKAVTSVSSVQGGDEEQHFEDTYKEFIATRERCGEPADGLTFERFRQKLLKSKEQLVLKHNAKGARFHVYVKDGKAALKASPLK
jgi:hypothetical protein